MGSLGVKFTSILLGVTLIQTMLMKLQSFWSGVQFLFIFFSDGRTLNL